MDRRARDGTFPAPPGRGQYLAEALVRTTLSLADAALRASYVVHVARAWELGALAGALDLICEWAEQAETASREALVAIVDALNGSGMDGVVQRLREEAAGQSLLALERLVRAPLRPSSSPGARTTSDGTSPAAQKDASLTGVIERGSGRGDGRGRPLTLGERKSLARRPDRDTMNRLLADSHPDVIRALLHNPRITEDDVVRLGAKRPGRGDVLTEVARSTKWSHRPRVRMALVMNPATPADIAARIAGLLLRPELEQVAHSPAVPASVRAVCLEHLERRPPVGDTSDRRVH